MEKKLLHRNSKTKAKAQTLIMLWLSIRILIPSTAFAQDVPVESNQYKLEYNPFILMPVTQTTETVDQDGNQELINENEAFAQKGYIIRSGFNGITATRPFALSILPAVISLDEGTKQQEKAAQIEIDGTAARGFTLFIEAENAFANSKKNEIPFASCDDILHPCSPYQAQTWQKNTLGLGFTVESNNKTKDFSPHAYRPFANAAKLEDEAEIANSSIAETVHQLMVHYRLVADSPNQLSGHVAALHFIALPHY